MKNRNELFVVLATALFLAFTVITVLNMGTGCGAANPLNQAKEKAKQADCTSKLKQIGLATMQYAMYYDDWYPTSTYYPRAAEERYMNNETYARTVTPKWMNADSGKSLELLRESDLLVDPKGYICPSKKGITAAQPNQTIAYGNHVSYNWCDGIVGGFCTMSPVACDGTDNHKSSGRFLRGDGSVGTANSRGGSSWTQDGQFRDFCYNKTYKDFSF